MPETTTDTTTATATDTAAAATAPATANAPQAATSTYTGGADAEQQLRDYVNGAGATADQIIILLHQATTAQRATLRNDTAFMNKALAVCNAAQTAAVVQAFFLEPKWMLYYYTVKKTGNDANLIKRMIGIGNGQQRIEIIGWQEVCEKIKSIIPTEHPDNVFGEDVAQHMAGTPETLRSYGTRYPWWLSWRQTTAKIDLDAHYTSLAASASMLTWGQGTPEPGIWSWIVQWTPRGLALSEGMRSALDTMALTHTAAFEMANFKKGFEIRFGIDVVSATDPAIGEAAFTLDKPNLKALWGQCANLPAGHVTQQMITRIAIYNANGGGGGWHNWLLGGTDAGDTAIGSGGAGGSWSYFNSTVRHEVGHAVDIQVGGFENFSSKGKAKWERYNTQDAFLDKFIQHAAGGDATLRAAAVAYMSDNNVANWNTAVDTADTAGKLTAPKLNVKASLPRVVAAGRVEADAKYNLNGRKFTRKYSRTEWQSYAVAGEETSTITSYAYNAYPEYFAEIYMKWFDGEPPNYHRGRNLPGWIATSGFAALVEGRSVNQVQGEDVGAGAGAGNGGSSG